MASDDRDEERPSRRPNDDSSSRSFSNLLDRIDASGARRGLRRGEPPAGDDHDVDASLSDLAEHVKDRLTPSEWQWVSFDDAPESELIDDVHEDMSFDAGDPKTTALLELLGDASNLLLQGPLSCPAEYEVCAKLLAPDPDVETNRLFVTYDQSPDDRLAVCRGHLGDLPGETVVVNVGDFTRSGVSTIRRGDHEAITVKTIANTDDLQRLGILISKHLSEWGDDADAVVCFHSLTTLLQFVDVRTAFRFLHVLQGRVRAAGARAHYHLDDDTLDEREIAMLRPLFDVALAYDQDGALSVSR